LTLYLIIVLIIGLAGIIGNQYSGLRRMEQSQKSLDEINQKLSQVKPPIIKD
jgi:hypothetical protein